MFKIYNVPHTNSSDIFRILEHVRLNCFFAKVRISEISEISGISEISERKTSSFLGDEPEVNAILESNGLQSSVCAAGTLIAAAAAPPSQLGSKKGIQTCRRMK